MGGYLFQGPSGDLQETQGDHSVDTHTNKHYATFIQGFSLNIVKDKQTYHVDSLSALKKKQLPLILGQQASTAPHLLPKINYDINIITCPVQLPTKIMLSLLLVELVKLNNVKE